MRILRWAVQTPARYVGMIGSKRKTITIFKELQQEGLPAALFDRVHAPVGLDIGAITPEEIAVSITAELIARRTKCGARASAYELRLATCEPGPKASTAEDAGNAERK